MDDNSVSWNDPVSSGDNHPLITACTCRHLCGFHCRAPLYIQEENPPVIPSGLKKAFRIFSHFFVQAALPWIPAPARSPWEVLPSHAPVYILMSRPDKD